MCVFYSPPRKGKNQALIDYLSENVHVLITKRNKAGFFLRGDKNSMDIVQLTRNLPNFRQTVSRPTHNNKILDVINMNSFQHYAVPVILPSHRPDNPLTHKRSDHMYAKAIPLDSSDDPRTRE